MFGIPRVRVEQLIAESGASVLVARPDQSAPGWTGFLYAVSKP
jgi:hypothetical protein